VGPAVLLIPLSGYSVYGLLLRIAGSGFRVQGAGFRVQGSGFRVQVLQGVPVPVLAAVCQLSRKRIAWA